jgi:protein-disulfide isomerase
VNEANFTAATPTRADVEAFLRTSWGYDLSRVWEVYAVQKTAAPGVSKVTVLVAQKQNPQQIANLVFFVTPDGKHLISQETVLDFGPHPYDNNHRILQQRADGPSRGSASRQFELVEFADFECPHCKEGQATVQKLVQDFPQARYVFENFPLVNIHQKAFEAAAYGACVAQQGGNEAFFKYADSVFAGQSALAGQDADQALRNAVTAAGLDPDKIAACANSPAGKSAVEASLHLGEELNVDQTPMLFVDGRAIPMMAVPYEELRQIVQYQFSLDQRSEKASGQ